MGKPQSKIEKPNANVVNNVEIIDHKDEINSLWTLTLILIIIAAVNLLLKIYVLHKRSIKKKYISRANDLDKV